jgi:N-acetylglucosaminyl-diphospho-decaprenol L-rhamnosyltransferase
MSRTVVVAIVNYRTPQQVIDCLQSLVEEVRAEPGLRVVVADNLSQDDSLTVLTEAIQREHWSWVALLPLSHNGGFASGNNAVIETVLEQVNPPEYIWLLNPDTLVHPHAATELINFLEDHPSVGIAGSRLMGNDESLQTAAFRFPSLLGELEDTIRLGFMTKALEPYRVPMKIADHPHKADWVSGASMMVRREVFESVGKMDDGFFLYYEETDFCKRTRLAGWEIWHVPNSKVIHLEGQSTGITGNHGPKKRRPTYWFDSRARYFNKNHGSTYALLADLIYIFGFSTWRCHRYLRKKNDPDPPYFLRDFVRHAVRRWC